MKECSSLAPGSGDYCKATCDDYCAQEDAKAAGTAAPDEGPLDPEEAALLQGSEVGGAVDKFFGDFGQKLFRPK
jgi:hypothetical protein